MDKNKIMTFKFKIVAIHFFIPLLLSAQNPSWFRLGQFEYSHSYSLLATDDFYPFDWQLPMLKSTVDSMEFSVEYSDPFINDSTNTIDNAAIVNLNSFHQIESLDFFEYKYEHYLNGTEKLKDKEHLYKESFGWADKQWMHKIYRINDEVKFIASPIYNDKKQIVREFWTYIGSTETFVYTFHIVYTQLENGNTLIKGLRGESFAKLDGTTKFELTLNNKNHIIQRKLYGSSLRTAINDERIIIFDYKYDNEGYLTTIKYQETNKPTAEYTFEYKDLDDRGNWTRQEIKKEGQLLDYSIIRNIKYKE